MHQTFLNQFQISLETTDKNRIQKFIEECCNQFYDKIYAYARYKFPSYYEDVAQETFKKFHEALLKGLKPSFQKEEDVLRYLLATARNIGYSMNRVKQVISIENCKVDNNFINPYKEINLRNDFESKLQLLCQKQARMLLMQMEGYSYHEISKVTGMKVDTVKKSIYRCRKKLKVLLKIRDKPRSLKHET